MVLLKQANVRSCDIVAFNCTTIRLVLEYSTPDYHHAPPQYLNGDIERVKRLPSIISLVVDVTPNKLSVYLYIHCLSCKASSDWQFKKEHFLFARK